jgi:hypothetical protein
VFYLAKEGGAGAAAAVAGQGMSEARLCKKGGESEWWWWGGGLGGWRVAARCMDERWQGVLRACVWRGGGAAAAAAAVAGQGMSAAQLCRKRREE